MDTRQIGIVQLPKSPTQPVFLHLPRGGFSDYARFVHAIQSLPAGILYVPSAQWLETDICHLARRHDLRIEPLAERFAIPELARPTPLSISGVARGSKGRQAKPTGLAAILNVKADWRWDRVIVRLTDAGTLIASHGEETGQHVFARNTGSGIRNYPQFFRTMLELSYHQQWINPHRGDPDYESRRQAFKRLREQLIQLIPIPEQPFRRRGGAWEPKFKVELDGALDSACRTWFPRSNERLRSTSIRQTGARQRVATSLSKDDASSYDEDESEPSDV